jgi:hypothetical protein
MKEKKYIWKKISKFKCIEISVLIILVFVPQPPILEMVPQMLFCSVSSKGKNKIEQNCTKQQQQKPHKVSQVQMQYSFSKFFSMLVYFSCFLIKGREREKKKRVWQQVCEWLSPAVALHRLEVWRSQSFASSRWPCLQGVSPASLQDLTLGGTCFLLPPSSCHLGILLVLL